ncbi:hypothetical protein QZH41_000302 [Actinostola sp. cb2023]|nr:hypothetical protein QZH41_000302 [Actinostola sp. cb2023]
MPSTKRFYLQKAFNISVSNSNPSPGATIDFKCTSTDRHQVLGYHWVKDKLHVVPGVRHKIVSDEKQSILTIRNIDPIDEGNYQCIVSNASQTWKSVNVVVKVKPVITIVPRSLTKFEGQATRRCIEGSDSKSKWGDPNLGNCTSIEFNKLLLQAEAIISRDYTPSYNASGLLQVLKDVTKKEGLNGGDIDATVTILSLLVNNSQTNNNTVITSDQDHQNVLDVCSNILEPANKIRWIQYEDQREKGTKSLWNRLVVTIDRYGLQLTNKMAGDTTKVIKTTNIVMRLDKITQQNKVKETGLQFAYREFQSSLFLPAEVFSSDSEYRVVSVVYKTLNAVMRLISNTNTTEHDTNENHAIRSNTSMIAEEHRKALELISTIGCSISLFAVLLTIGVTMFFWKTLKSPRTIVLMNICVAIAVVCGLVIAEGTTRDTKQKELQVTLRLVCGLVIAEETARDTKYCNYKALFDQPNTIGDFRILIANIFLPSRP